MTNLNAFLPFVNGRLGFLFRHALWIPDRKHRVVKLTPEACHLHLGRNRFKTIIYANPQYSQAAHANLDWFMRSLHRYDLQFANRFAPALNFGFDTYTSQPDETNGIDTNIEHDTPTTNYGTSDRINVGESNAAAKIYRGLIKFPFTSFTWPIFASSGIVSLWKFLDAATNDRTMRVYRMKQAWTELGVTWNTYDGSTSWPGGAGGFGASDCEQTEIASRVITNAEAQGEKQWSLDPAALNAMIDGNWVNNGLMWKNDIENNDAHVFSSSTRGIPGERPKLTMEYLNQDASGWWL